MIDLSEKIANNLKKALAQSVKVPVSTDEMVAEIDTEKPEVTDEVEKGGNSDPFGDIRSSIENLKLFIGRAKLGSASDADRALNELSLLRALVDRAQKFQA